MKDSTKKTIDKLRSEGFDGETRHRLCNELSSLLEKREGDKPKWCGLDVPSCSFRDEAEEHEEDCKANCNGYKKTCGDSAVLDSLSGKIEIIHKNNIPYGIRDASGYLFFFTGVSKYQGQEERYRREVKEKFELADFLLLKLKSAIKEEE